MTVYIGYPRMEAWIKVLSPEDDVYVSMQSQQVDKAYDLFVVCAHVFQDTVRYCRIKFGTVTNVNVGHLEYANKMVYNMVEVARDSISDWLRYHSLKLNVHNAVVDWPEDNEHVTSTFSLLKYDKAKNMYFIMTTDEAETERRKMFGNDGGLSLLQS